MRIQETNRILKETTYARQTPQQQHDEGMVSRAWKLVSHLPEMITGLFRKH
jgi:hypothetical protein